MTVRTPTPFAAAIGLAAEAAEQLRRLPALLVELPPTVTRQLETVRQAARERYDELALHGRDVLAGRHAGAPEAAVPDSFGAPSVATEPGTEPVAEPRTEPPAPLPPLGRTEPVEIPDDVLEDVAQLAPGDELAHADLPLPDFDHQTVPQLRGRLRTLALPELIQLRDYEQAHARRLPVLTLLDNRIAKLTESSTE
jgi:hypothetical protein